MIGLDGTGSMLGDPRFFERAGPFDLPDLVAVTSGKADRAEIFEGRQITGVASLQSARADQVAVLHNPRYANVAERTEAGVVIVGAALVGRVAPHSVPLIVDDPHEAWARAAALFHPVASPVAGIHATAVVHELATIDPTAEIGAYAVVGAHAEIGARCQVGAGAVIGAGVVLGADCRVGVSASLSHAILGERVHIYPGARIGQEGFGFAVTKAGFVTVPQLGRVILHDDVEIGANATIDRGASQDTILGQGSRIDNLIQIGHNVQMGQYCIMAAQSGISGSSTLGDFVQIGAQAGLAGHVNVGARARIGAQAGVMSDLAAGVEVIGSPALPFREFFRNVAVLRRLARRGLAEKLSSGEKAVD